MLIKNIKKNYGSHSTLVLYRKEFNAEPPACTLHESVNCQLCFKRGSLNGKTYNDLTPEELFRYNVNRKSSTRRSKTSVTDYALANEFTQFITLTIDPKLIDSKDFDLCKKRVSKWLNNQRRHSPKLTYIIVAEKHKKGGIHFHAVVNNYNGKLEVAVNKKTGRKLTKNGKQIYNLSGWPYGFSTLSNIENKEATAYYLTKYLTKDFIEAFNKKRFWTSRNLIKPTKEYNVEFDARDIPPLFMELHKTENYYKYKLMYGAERQKQLNDTKEFTRQKISDMVRAH